MRRNCFRYLAPVALMLAGCNAGGLTPNQKVEANKEWNHARATVLASLAADQLKDGSLDKCQETLLQALRLEPDDFKLHLLQARLSIEQGQLDNADTHLSDARRIDPSNAEADYYTGIVYQRWQQPQKAFAEYSLAAKKDPTEASYPLAEAEMMVAMNDAPGAVTLLQSNLKVFEHNVAICDELGQLLVQQKQFAPGIAALREANMLATNDSTIREHLGFALLEDRQYSESENCFAGLLKDTAFTDRADIHAAYAECLSQSNQISTAKRQFELATQSNPTCSGYWLGLAKVSLQLQDMLGAELAIRKAIAIDIKSSEAQCLLGYLRMKQNQLPESLSAFHSAADLNPMDSVSVCMQGFILTRLGRRTEARSYYSHALELDSNNALAKQMIAN